MQHKQDYIAIPENIYLAIREYLAAMPYKEVHGIMRALDTTAKKVPTEIIPSSEAPVT